jgi:cytochrome P450
MKPRGTSQLLRNTLFPKVFIIFALVIPGSMVIPTLWHSLHDEIVYPDAHKYNPARWGPGGTAEQHPKFVLPVNQSNL